MRMGPLTGVKILEIASIGPGPFAAMLLSDMGAEVVRIDRAGSVRASNPEQPPQDILNRGRRSIGVDLKHADGVAAVLRMVDGSDGLVEGFRPGVMERLGLGPELCLARNPRLVYGRMTGFGQEGPLARSAGHDINYISIAGALEAIGRQGDAPMPPLNLVGDFGGGGMLLAFGVACALVERSASGKGQVVDAAMIDGAALLMTMMRGMLDGGAWRDERGTNMLDTGAHFYEVYETSDGKYVSVGSIEPRFYAELLRRTGLDGDADFARQMDRSAWPSLKGRLATLFRSRTRDEWCAIMDGADVCFAPVLSMREAPAHPHNQARRTFVEYQGQVQPAPGPRFSRTPGAIAGPSAVPGQHTDQVLADWGFADDEIAHLRKTKAVA
ncbi:MAG: CaiB/BaiF CoA-transferase family protein [Acidobacteria bacterium]|nr:CaiB/BaiF CoA-transferase family protein [Acidobacteriota bacterium]